MIYPTIEELTKGEFNRYELVVAVAKCARIVTDEYVAMRARAQRLIDNRETDKPLSALIDPEGGQDRHRETAGRKIPYSSPCRRRIITHRRTEEKDVLRDLPDRCPIRA